MVQKGSWYRDLAQVVRQDRSSRSLKDPDASCRTGAWYRDLAQVVRQDPDTSAPIDPPETSGPKKLSYRILGKILDPDTIGPKGSWYKDLALVVRGPWCNWSEKFLIRIWILIRRSCTNGPTGSWYEWSERILIQRSCTSGPAESWYKWSTRVLIQGSWNRGFAQVALQNLDTGDPKESSYRDPETETSHKRYHKILARA